MSHLDPKRRACMLLSLLLTPRRFGTNSDILWSPPPTERRKVLLESGLTRPVLMRVLDCTPANLARDLKIGRKVGAPCRDEAMPVRSVTARLKTWNSLINLRLYHTCAVHG